MRKKATLIIPAYNEGKNVEALLRAIPDNFEVIVIDDGSTDNTGTIAKKYCEVIKHRQNRGKGAAMKAGAKKAKEGILIFMDGDKQHNPRDLPLFLKTSGKNKLVVGNRFARPSDMPLTRRASNSFARAGMRMAGVAVHDALCGYRAITKKDFLSLNLEHDDYRIEAEMVIKAREKGMNIVEIPVNVRYGGYSSSLGLMDGAKIALLIAANVLK
jgi:glycosyltransferase involved in cell wall biosynthesis